MNDWITIDGSQGEGGGQILRTSLALSAIKGRKIEIVKIRAGREKPGLKRQHLTCVRAVAEICGAKMSDAEVGSMALTFQPGLIRGGDYRFDVEDDIRSVLCTLCIVDLIGRTTVAAPLHGL